MKLYFITLLIAVFSAFAIADEMVHSVGPDSIRLTKELCSSKILDLIKLERQLPFKKQLLRLKVKLMLDAGLLFKI